MQEWNALSLSTDEDLVRAIVRFATLRRQTADVNPMSLLWPQMLLFAILLIPLADRRSTRSCKDSGGGFAAKYGSLGLASAGTGIGMRRSHPSYSVPDRSLDLDVCPGSTTNSCQPAAH